MRELVGSKNTIDQKWPCVEKLQKGTFNLLIFMRAMYFKIQILCIFPTEIVNTLSFPL